MVRENTKSARKRAINILTNRLVRYIEDGRVSVFIEYPNSRQFCGRRQRGLVQAYVLCTEARTADGRWTFVQERTERHTAFVRAAIRAALARAGARIVVYPSMGGAEHCLLVKRGA